ncbi:addiction module toxin, HicA family [Candidatus Nomurabacteria bacterium RIFCSPLOWO2_01_FULL_41_21]|uniref:Addiction module toxin, HicA family n=2 Tax=Candidatus Nomuraibacteriota TaxID=1752729 RepID=A0A1F6V3L2_9BACT|nr:MAG: addiction module toxin, HicA family [Candidatus Nomurabacteria bacterium RIFCSPHIGHO2_01_FULL_40_20]OGI88833.1 MAG: addiction module toxin, HicA family [Candidatus Nomurabacteria bacterium RIFCSPLOWO2_01_FULL_41_21]
MKRTDLILHLRKNGVVFLREGNSHSIYFNPENSRVSSIPRHSEINTFTGRKICRDLGVPMIQKK